MTMIGVHTMRFQLRKRIPVESALDVTVADALVSVRVTGGGWVTVLGSLVVDAEVVVEEAAEEIVEEVVEEEKGEGEEQEEEKQQQRRSMPTMTAIQ